MLCENAAESYGENALYIFYLVYKNDFRWKPKGILDIILDAKIKCNS